ncbi:unknown [Bacteroides sp. CAG:189]|nr:unknown [Bacteroides sp. CAG:189]
MKHYATEKLYIIVNHVPYRVVTAGIPVILIDSLVAFDAYEVFCCSQCTVEVGSRNHHFFVFRKTSCGIFHDRKSHRQYFVERFFVYFKNFFFQFVYLSENLFTVFQLYGFDTGFQFFHFSAFLVCRVVDVLLKFLCFRTETVIIQFSNLWVSSFDLVYPRLNFFHVSRGFVSENRA